MATKKKAVKKTAARFVKGSKAAKDFMAKLRAKRSEGKYQYGETNKVKDKRIQAKKAGKRVAKKSKKVYYEYRANRSDVDQRLKNKGGTLLGIGKKKITDYFQYHIIKKLERSIDELNMVNNEIILHRGNNEDIVKKNIKFKKELITHIKELKKLL